MKNKLLHIFLFIAILLSSLNLTTYAADTVSGTYGNVKYVLDWDTMTLTISGSGEISNSALLDGSHLNEYGYDKVIINEGITKVSDDIMSSPYLQSVSIPSSVTYFAPANITNCKKLTTITVNSNNKNYSASSNVLFNKSKTELVCYPMGKTGTTYTIPSTVKTIGEKAFYKSLLSSISIPSTVTQVGASAFASSSSLTTVTLTNGIKEISEKMFSNCKALKSINFPEGITKINAEAFNSCKVLPSLTLPKSLTYIGNAAFEDCDGMTTVNLGGNVTTLSEEAFRSCGALTKVSGAGNVTDIGRYTFYSCKLLSSVDVSDKLTCIEDSAFDTCESIATIYLGTGLTKIGENAFEQCIKLTTITIPKNVTTIGYSPFVNCSSLSKILVDTNNTHFISQDGILYSKDKSRLIQYPGAKSGSFTIPNTVTVIGNSAFEYCLNLTSVVIPSSVKTIEYAAFAGCGNLSTATIGSGITSLDEYVFETCENLSSIIIPPSVTTIVSTTFDDANPDMIIKGKSGSYAQTFANANGYTFNALTTYTITYNANGGSNAPTAQPKFQSLNTDLYMQEPARANHKFLGWATSSTSKTIEYKPGATYSANANITLYAVWEYLYPTNFTLSTLNVNLYIGDSERVLVTSYTPSTAENKTLKWTSGNQSIAMVNPNDGVITAVSPGTTTITAKTGDGKVSKTVSVTVIKPANNIDFSLSETKQSPTSSNIKMTIEGDKLLVKNIKWAYGSQNESYFASSGTSVDLSKLNVLVDKNGIYTFCLTDVDDNKKIKTINVSKIAIEQPQFTNSSGVLETENELYIPINFDEIDENISIYMALYDNGKLTKLEKTLCVPSENTGKKEFRKTFNVVYPKKGYELKVFVWNENLMPYLNGISLKSNSSVSEQIFEGTISSEDTQIHEFTVSENRTHSIKSYINEGVNVALYGYLFDSDGNNIAIDENDADKGFEFDVNLESGKTYSLMIINLNDNTFGNYMIVIK